VKIDARKSPEDSGRPNQLHGLSRIRLFKFVKNGATVYVRRGSDLGDLGKGENLRGSGEEEEQRS